MQCLKTTNEIPHKKSHYSLMKTTMAFKIILPTGAELCPESSLLLIYT